MKKRHYLLLLLATLPLLGGFAQNGKKVYADYHGVRTTRVMEGEYGNWRYISNTSGSANGPKRLAYNPDLILENGRENIAAANYPEVGMQSQLDPAYIEYEILSAKVAKIDGFWIEWGYVDHSSNDLLKAMQPIAEKFKFEIGVNICDAWLFNNNWITQVKPEIVTHEQKRTYFKDNIQYLLDNVLTGPTAPRVNGKPVVYLFGTGMKADDLKWLKQQTYTYPEGTPFPEILLRTAPKGSITGGKYVPGSPLAEANKWAGTGIIPTPWIPERVRKGTPTSAFPTYDFYAVTSDVELYQGKFNEEIWSSNAYAVRSAVAVPGMDNIGCGNWSDKNAKFHMINRNGGKTYKAMWDYNLANKDKLDMIYLISWSDYTEGHEIAPTVENKDRELRTTLENAAKFKNETADNAGMGQPFRLFKARKKLDFLLELEFEVAAQQSKLDVIAKNIAEAKYKDAEKALAEVETFIAKQEERVVKHEIKVASSDLKIAGGTYNEADKTYTLTGGRFGLGLPQEVRDQLKEGTYEGYMLFEFFDDLTSDINITHKTKKEPTKTFKATAQLKQFAEKKWNKAKIRIHKAITELDGTEWLTEKADFSIYARTKIKDISFEFDHFVATDEVIDTSVKSLTINGEPHNDLSIPYEVSCDWKEDNLLISVEAPEGATVEGGSDIKVFLPNGVGSKTVEFTIIGSDDKTKEKHQLTISKPQFKFNEVVVQKWNNAFIINNNLFTNGGYKFSSYRWFEDAREIGTGQVYTTQEGFKSDAQYSVELTTTDGRIIKVCPSKPIIMKGGIFIYPNPVASGDNFNIQAELPEGYNIQDMAVEVYNSVGALVINQKLTGETTSIPAPRTSGFYAVKVFGKDLKKEFKLIVR